MAMMVVNADPRADAVPVERPPCRLPPERANEVRDVARGELETAAGLACQALEASPAMSSDPDDPTLHPLEAFVDALGVLTRSTRTWRARVGRTVRAFAAMRVAGHGRHANALMVVYGYPDPITCRLPENMLRYLGRELAPLARYVDAVEDKRREMARIEASRADRGNPVADLGARRARYDHAMRALTSADALMAATGSYPLPRPDRRPGEADAPYRVRVADHDARRSAWEASRTSFVVRVRREACAMLSDASDAYGDAWRAAGGNVVVVRRDDMDAAAVYQRMQRYSPSTDGVLLADARARGAGWSTT